MSLPYPSGRSERSAIGDLLRDLFHKISELISTQVELTKTEIKVESRKLVTAAAYGIAALITGFVFVVFLGISLMLAFSQLVGFTLGAVITTAIMLLMTGAATMLMVSELQKNSAAIDVEE